jgi:nucleotide-binding universal stress UspA family protein
MAYRVILANLAGTDEDHIVLDAAYVVALRADAHVRALHVRPDPASILVLASPESAVVAGQLMAAAEKESAEGALRARSAFDAWLAKNRLQIVSRKPESRGVTAEWVEEMGTPSDALAANGRLADLVVLAARLFHGNTRNAEAIEAALFDTGRPVLIVPETLPADLFATAVIGWKPGREAARAVAASLPLLERCAKVEVFSSEEKAAPVDPQELVNFLNWHGISATAGKPPAGPAPVGAALLSFAARERASLLVLGAYSHTRLRELVLGGVTRHVLEHAELPLLMAH